MFIIRTLLAGPQVSALYRFHCTSTYLLLYPDDVILQRNRQRGKSDTPGDRINVLKRPFRITINVIFYTEELETFTADLVFFPCYWKYMVGSPSSGHFLIADALDCSDYKFLFAKRFSDQVWYRTDPQSTKHPKLLTCKSFR